MLASVNSDLHISFLSLQIIRVLWSIWHREKAFLLVVQAAYWLNMPWDNSVNSMTHINAIASTLDVKNMPLAS